jgi:uncharacterized membrane protein
MTDIKRSIFINAPTEKVFDYMAEPNNLVKWVHNCLEVSEVVPEGTLREGTTYTSLEKLPAGMKVRGSSKVTKYERPYNLDFESPFAGKCLIFLCRLQPKDNGTLFTNIADYTMPWGFLGKVIDKLFMKKHITGNVEHTVQKLKAVMVSGHPES